jgi:hypothetical protein
VAPGMITGIYGGNLGPQQGVIATPDSTGKYGNSLDGVQVQRCRGANPLRTSVAGQRDRPLRSRRDEYRKYPRRV